MRAILAHNRRVRRGLTQALGPTEKFMQPKKSTPTPPYLYFAVGVIFLLSAWSASFSRSCQSDGCIGVVFPIGAALIALAVQIFVLIPIYRIGRSRTREESPPPVGTWIAASVAAFALPMLFAKI